MTWVFSCLEYDSFSLDLCVHELIMYIKVDEYDSIAHFLLFISSNHDFEPIAIYKTNNA